MKALSVRQPWAWLIVNGHKDIENRSWPTKVLGTVLVHASKGMTRDEYEAAEQTIGMHGMDIPLPAIEDLERGGIVGTVDIVGCTPLSTSPWFFGPYGFKLANAKPVPFVPLLGKLGFFEAPDCTPVCHEKEEKGGAQ